MLIGGRGGGTTATGFVLGRIDGIGGGGAGEPGPRTDGSFGGGGIGVCGGGVSSSRSSTSIGDETSGIVSLASGVPLGESFSSRSVGAESRLSVLFGGGA